MPKKRTAAKTKKTNKQPKVVKSSAAKGVPTRRLKYPKYSHFRLSKKIKHPSPKLSPAWRLFGRSIVSLVKYWKIFLGILVIYILLTLALVKGFSLNSGLIDFKQTLQTISSTTPLNLNSSITLLNFLISNSGPTNDVATAYLSILLVIMSLAIIWALRQTQAGLKITVRDVFYKGLYPLVPLILVLLVISLQTIPLLGANFLYSIIFGTVAVSLIEKALWVILFFLLVVLSLYMITSSIFALYIVTLPDVTPLQALRAAQQLVRFRRWTIMRKLLFLPFILLLIGTVILLPIILYLTVAAEWTYFCLSIAALFVIHSYIYTVYRELLL